MGPIEGVAALLAGVIAYYLRRGVGMFARALEHRLGIEQDSEARALIETAISNGLLLSHALSPASAEAAGEAAAAYVAKLVPDALARLDIDWEGLVLLVAARAAKSGYVPAQGVLPPVPTAGEG